MRNLLPLFLQMVLDMNSVGMLSAVDVEGSPEHRQVLEG
jgi:hypothetical protein